MISTLLLLVPGVLALAAVVDVAALVEVEP
jgi:hypothetical protein